MNYLHPFDKHRVRWSELYLLPLLLASRLPAYVFSSLIISLHYNISLTRLLKLNSESFIFCSKIKSVGMTWELRARWRFKINLEDWFPSFYIFYEQCGFIQAAVSRSIPSSRLMTDLLYKYEMIQLLLLFLKFCYGIHIWK